MDVDPLADTVPPRYAIESDDEDEYNPQPQHPTQTPTTDIKFIGKFPSGLPLVFASGDAGESWARGAKLGPPQGGIYVDNEQVGILFLPLWTQAAVIVSETSMHLPLSVMNNYTTAIIDHIQPARVSVLDTYSVQGYISPKVVPLDNAPVRYLSLGDVTISDPEIELFAPPNLVQSTTASLLARLLVRSLPLKLTKNYDAALFLLPSPKLPLALPTTITPSPSDDIHWDQRIMQKVHRLLFEVIGEGENVDPWVETSDRLSKLSVAHQRRRAEEIGEGGMYI
ncbi:hypothetical protein V8B97DRAFT_2053957 [Scleroderma yunnanense]